MREPIDEAAAALWIADHFEAWRRLELADAVLLIGARFDLPPSAAVRLILAGLEAVLEERRERLRAAELASARTDFLARGIDVRGIDRRLIDMGRTRARFPRAAH